MLLTEVNRLQNTDGFLVEDANQLIRYCKQVFNKADQNADFDNKYKAINYIAFLMAYRDMHHEFGEGCPLPIEHFLQPGVRSAMVALQHYAKNANDDTDVMKKVKKHCTKMLDPQTGPRYFEYQCDKLDKYFQRNNQR